MKRVANEYEGRGKTEKERETTGTVSENRIRGDQVTGRTRPRGGRRERRVSSFSTPVLPRTAQSGA